MLKNIISLLLIFTLVLTGTIIPVFAEGTTEDTSVSLWMNGEMLTENENGSLNYTYVVNSLDDIPVLSCSFNSNVYTCLVRQPERQNGYIGTVTLTDNSSGEVSVHTVRVYDNNTFKSHFINLGGDPWVTYHDGWYYYMVTGNGFYVSKSRELERVNSNPVSVFKMADLVDNVNFKIVKELWAPELHFIDGFWYIYFTAYDGEEKSNETSSGVTGHAKNHRMFVLKSKTDDAQGEYEFMGQINELEDDYIGDSKYDAADDKTSHYAIDQTVFEWNERLYAVWSGWPSYESIGQRLYIAEMSDPCTISSNRVEISRPEFAYETYSMIPAINEAPQALISPDGKTLNIAFSVNRFDDSTYSLGLLTLKENGDPLNAEDWIKTDQPVFETSINNSTYSVGHCSFVPSPDKSEYYVVYHARRGNDTDQNPREIRTQQFFWYDDGTPCFDEAISADTPVQIPSGTPIFDRAELEAEDAVLSGGAFIVTDAHSITTYDDDYYSGSKRISLTGSGRTATFTYNASTAGKYNFTLLASGSSNTTSGLSVNVNGTEYKAQVQGVMGNINIFAYYDIPNIELNEGENTITVAHTSAFASGAYLDRLDIVCQDDAAALWEAQDAINAECTKKPVVREKLTTQRTETNWGEETVFDSFGDFDKYWYNSQPFRQEYGEDAITTVRPGGNKRLLVSDKAFHNIADFKASVEITPSAAHIAADNGVQVEEENYTTGVGINSGIIFRVGEMRDYTSNIVSFSGYRCFIIASGNGQIKIQAHKYYFTDATSLKATGKVLATSSAMAYTPGDTYILEVEVEGNTLNATAYNQNDSETQIKLSNVNLKPDSTLQYEESGRIGLYSMPIKGRVTFDNLKITPYRTSASLISDYGNLNRLSAYSTYTTATSRNFSEDCGIISIPTGVAKLLIADENAQNVSDFSAGVKITITNTSQLVQTGLAFRVNDITTGTPGITGYVLALNRTSSHDMNTIVVGLTKYGVKGTSTNVNLGNQSFTDKNLLSDITQKADITGISFYMTAVVKDNMLQATVTRCDNPELTSTYNWQIDDPDYKVNQNYPVYYTDGKIGIFSNGVAKISEIEINNIKPENYGITLTDDKGGNIAASKPRFEGNQNVKVTMRADSGYYINPYKLYATAQDKNITLFCDKSYSDIAAVYHFTSPAAEVALCNAFTPILTGDANCDENLSITDLIRTKKYLAQNEDIIGISNADIDQSGVINAKDIAALRKLLLRNGEI